MSKSVRVYVNGDALDVPAGATAFDAIAAWDPAEAQQIHAGNRAIVDNRGLPLSPESAIYAGAIMRVVSARQARNAANESDS